MEGSQRVCFRFVATTGGLSNKKTTRSAVEMASHSEAFNVLGFGCISRPKGTRDTSI